MIDAHRRMVEDQLMASGIRDQRVLGAIRKVERQRFVRSEDRDLAYADRPLPIGYGQTISQPYIVGLMTELLELHPTDRVLEIGTGSGYQTAILAELVNEVYTLELQEELQLRAVALLRSLGYTNIRALCADGYAGYPEAAPYNAIMVTAAPPAVPAKLVEQLAPAGRLVIPVGVYDQTLYLLRKDDDGVLSRRRILAVSFVPLRSQP